MPRTKTKKKLSSNSYKDAGVDIDAGNELVKRITPLANSTSREGAISSLGGFGALFDLKAAGYDDPILVAATDGVGTKLKIAIDAKILNFVGIDLVAMCVNDLICQGAEPLFFLDYLATGKLDVKLAEQIVTGIVAGCKEAKIALIGGETAEMPGMYQDDDYDLAGFCVGVVEESEVVTGDNVAEGDVLIALASSGAHSNGYSLVRKVIEVSGVDVATSDEQLDGQPIQDALMAPTRIYVKAIKALQDTLGSSALHAMSHITGGGLTDNLPRVLPDDLAASIDTSSWQFSELFTWLQTQGNIEQSEMYRTFNCGVGFVIVVPKDKAEATIKTLTDAGENAWQLGEMVKREADAVVYR